jgi:hypothetical protein
METVMSSEKTPARQREAQRPDHELDRRYGAIGISAVAAAVRYHCGPRPASDDRDDDQQRRERAGRAA